MSFRKRVFVVLVGVTLVTNSFSLFVLYEEFKGQLITQIRQGYEDIAVTAAALLDGDKHEAFNKTLSEESVEYKSLEKDLRKIRDANRAIGTDAGYVYTIIRDPKHPDTLIYAIDPEENYTDKSHPGEIFRYHGEEKIPFGENFVTKTPRTDGWGEWYSGSAPVRDSSGEVVAQVVIDIPSSSVLQQLVLEREEAVVALGVALLLSLICAVSFSKSITKPLVNLKEAVDGIASGNLDVVVELKRKDEFGSLGQSINLMTQGLKERGTLKNAFARYVSKQVMDSVLKDSSGAELKGSRKRITVLFSDIRGFTTMSEKMRPEDVVGFLNEYFEKMLEIIFRHQGTLDKFIGDGIMVIFGAPLDDPDQEEHAVKAAIEMQHETNKLCEKWKAEGRPEIRIGIGIHSGPAVVGNIGSSARMEYTAVGDTVNLAARLESATKDLGVQILISEYTYAAIRALYEFKKIGSVTVKGRSDPVSTYTVQ